MKPIAPLGELVHRLRAAAEGDVPPNWALGDGHSSCDESPWTSRVVAHRCWCQSRRLLSAPRTVLQDVPPAFCGQRRMMMLMPWLMPDLNARLGLPEQGV